MRRIKARLVRLGLFLTTGTVVAIDLCPNVWDQLTGRS